MHWYINWKSSVSSTEETSRFYSLSIKLMSITQTRYYEMSWKLVLIVSVWNQLRGLKWAALCLTDRICYDRSSWWRNLKKLIMYSAKLVVNSPLLFFLVGEEELGLWGILNLEAQTPVEMFLWIYLLIFLKK